MQNKCLLLTIAQYLLLGATGWFLQCNIVAPISIDIIFVLHGHVSLLRFKE